MAKGVTKREELYNLYAQGYGWKSGEAKAIAKNSGTRETYYREWEKTGRPGYIGQQFETESLGSRGRESETKTLPPPPPPPPPPDDGKHGAAFEVPMEVTPKKPPIVIGQISIPRADWGFSDEGEMLLVASTYHEVIKPKNKGGYGYTGLVGDFMADCVRLFRRVFDFDPMREEITTEESLDERRAVLAGRSGNEADGEESEG